MTTDTKTLDGYQIATEQIIAMLTEGNIPWRNHFTVFPANFFNRRPYNGVNVLLLSCLGYPENYFLTHNQLVKAGGTLLEDQKPATVLHWTKAELQTYWVYNIAQCKGIPRTDQPPFDPDLPNPLDLCDYIFDNMPKPPTLKQGKEEYGSYQPFLDVITMPKPAKYESMEHYWWAFFKELIHSTGHHSRLNRKEVTQLKTLGCDPFSIEELIGEIGACFLASDAHLSCTLFDPEEYITGWLKKFKEDYRIIVFAASKAHEAYAHIINLKRFEEQ